MRALRHAGWLELVSEDNGIVLHELPPLAEPDGEPP